MSTAVPVSVDVLAPDTANSSRLNSSLQLIIFMIFSPFAANGFFSFSNIFRFYCFCLCKYCRQLCLTIFSLRIIDQYACYRIFYFYRAVISGKQLACNKGVLNDFNCLHIVSFFMTVGNLLIAYCLLLTELRCRKMHRNCLHASLPHPPTEWL